MVFSHITYLICLFPFLIYARSRTPYHENVMEYDMQLPSDFMKTPQQPPLIPHLDFDYVKALQKTITFYDIQKSGKINNNNQSKNRLNWRGDSLLKDGQDNYIDLVGGFTDAGDNVKFVFPMAYTIGILAWSAVTFPKALDNSGQRIFLENNIRWGCDFLLKAHTQPNTLYGQVGKGDDDHAFWGAQEIVDYVMNRPSYKIDQSCPGSELAGSTATALTWSAILFNSTDVQYSQTLLSHAQQIYSFAETYLGKYSDCIADAKSFYNPGPYWDELTEGAAVLYLATNNISYLNKSQTYYQKLSNDYTGVKTFTGANNWDDKTYASYLLLALITGNQTYRDDITRWLDYWTDGYQGRRVPYTTGGLAYWTEWGNLRFPATTGFLAQIWANNISASDPTRSKKYIQFANSQIDYILGSNPMNISYLIGYGNYPLNAHHRTCHSAWNGDIVTPMNPRHICYGVLIGGPYFNDTLVDNKEDYSHTETALDYVSGVVGCLLGLVDKYGGTPDSNFPPIETPGLEFYVTASINSQTRTYTEINTFMTNQAGWPARSSSSLSLKYFINLTTSINAGIPVSQIKFSLELNAGAHMNPVLQIWDISKSIYYLEIDWNDYAIYPGGASKFQAEAQFRIGVPDGSPTGSWNPTYDWSYQTLAIGDPILTDFIPVYENGALLYGKEPPKPNQKNTVEAKKIDISKKQDNMGLSTSTAWTWYPGLEPFHQIGSQVNSTSWQTTATSQPSTFLTYGPYLVNIPLTSLRLDFTLSIDDNKKDLQNVLQLVVWDSATVSMIQSMTVPRFAFQQPNTPQIFSLFFDNTNPVANLQFQVFYVGGAIITHHLTSLVTV